MAMIKCPECRKEIAFALFLSVCLSLSGCGSSGISQEEYNRVVAERDNYKEQLDNITSEKETNHNETDVVEIEKEPVVETQESEFPQDSEKLSTGIYIVGEDIDSGKYDFYGFKGTGSLKIYKSYDDYKNDEYGFNAFAEFDILSNGASVGLLNEDVYTDIVSNIRIYDSWCLVIDKGLELQYYLSGSVDDAVLPVGTYIVGEDIKAGKYNFTAIKGSGSVKIYNSYDEYLEDIYGYQSFSDYDMKNENASVGLLNEDVYTETINNIRLDEGQCLLIEDGLKLEYQLQ